MKKVLRVLGIIIAGIVVLILGGMMFVIEDIYDMWINEFFMANPVVLIILIVGIPAVVVGIVVIYNRYS